MNEQASIFNKCSPTLANVVLEFYEKINQLQGLEKKDIIMIEKLKKIILNG